MGTKCFLICICLLAIFIPTETFADSAPYINMGRGKRYGVWYGRPYHYRSEYYYYPNYYRYYNYSPYRQYYEEGW